MSEPRAEERRGPSTALGSRVIRGSAWMLAMRWSVRLVGIVNTAVLARLLTPEDFGVVAMAGMVIAILMVFDDVGLELCIVRQPNLTHAHLDTAWTVRIALSLVIALLIAGAAPLTARFFAEPRLVPVMLALALAPVIGGLWNVSVMMYLRDLNYAKDFEINVVVRVLSAVVGITVAVMLRNYWALVAAMLIQPVIKVVASYAYHPYRPRLSLAAIHDIWSFSAWMFLRNLANWAAGRIDQFLVGRMVGASGLGGYFVASQIAGMVVMETVLPLGRALIPGYAKLLDDKARLAQALVTVAGVTAIIAIPFGFGLAAVAEDFVLVLLGPKWTAAAPLLQVFAVAAAASGIMSPAGPYTMATGKLRLMTLIVWAMAGAIAVAIAAAAGTGDPRWIAIARAGVVIVFVPVVYGLVLVPECPSPGRLVGGVLRPLLAGVAMVAVVRALHLGSVANPAITLPIDVLTGAVTYPVALLGIWWVSGRPVGGEGELIARLRPLLRRAVRG